MCLHEGVEQQDEGVEDDGHAEDHEHFGRHGQLLRRVGRAQQPDDRLRHGKQARRARHGDQRHGADGGFLRRAYIVKLPARQGGGDGRDAGNGDRRDERARKGEDRLLIVVDALEVFRHLHAPAEAKLQTAHIDHGVEKVDDLKARRAERDGHGDGEQLLHGGAAALRRSGGVRQRGACAAVFDVQIDHRDQAAERHAEDRAARGKRDIAVIRDGLARLEDDPVFMDEALAGQLHDEPRKPEAHDQTGDGFKDLADGGGGHAALALEEAPVGRDQADQQHARRQRRDGRPGIFAVRDHHRELAAEHQHHKASGDAEGDKDIDGRLEDALDLRLVSERLRLGDHAAHGNGQTRGGDHEQDVVNVIGGVEIAEAGRADDIVERGLEQKAHELDQNGRHGENCRALQKCLLLNLLFVHSAASSASGCASAKTVGTA